MKLAILHLSDIHINSHKDTILTRGLDISRTAFTISRTADACLILVTGDIAFSGLANQYEAARKLLEEIRDSIKSEGCQVVDIFMVPGNHDCQLKPENKVRSIVIEHLINENRIANDPSCVDICVSAQSEYFKFRSLVTKTVPAKDDPLWTDYELIISGRVVRISAINASWMSRLPENPGSLVFPSDKFQEWISEPAELRIAMVHHPLNWYSQSSYHTLRSTLRTNCSVVLSGHEHVINRGEIAENGHGRQLFFEAQALQPHDSENSAGFSVLFLDTDNDIAIHNQFTIKPLGIERGQTFEANIRTLLKGDSNNLNITKEFSNILRDPGGGFGHPEKEHLDIDDVFVYPELRIIDREDKHDKSFSTPSDDVLFNESGPEKILLLGEEKSGKSTLLLRTFSEFHSRGLVPLYIRADTISEFSSKEIAKTITKATQFQYTDSASVQQTERAKRVCLIDDLDRLKGGARFLIKLIQEIEPHFSKIIITASQGFEIRELVNPDAAKALKPYFTYELCRFGNTLRHRLIQKWCQLGNVSTLPELDRQVHSTEAVVNAIVSRNLTPSLPIYLLILLQSHSQHQQGELQNSGFARYYEYLMTRSLDKAGIHKDEYDELFNYLSQLSWLFRNTDKEEITKQELVAFTRQYSEGYFSVDLDSRLTLLINARLFNKRGNNYQFAYPYVYYFFLGRYLAKNLSDTEVKTKVSLWCQKLYLRKNAHAIVFLSYHSNEEWIVDQISNLLDNCLSDISPIELGSDISAINSLVDNTSKLLIDEPNVPLNQEQVRRNLDEEESNTQDETDYPENGEIAILGKINLLLKASEILGQIVKNYYGSTKRSRKEELIKKVISGPLRLLRFILQMVAEDPEAFIVEMEKTISVHHKNLNDIEKKRIAREVAFQILGLISTGALMRTAEWIGSERLEEDIAKVVRDNPTTAFKLVEAGTHLLLPRDLALDKIRKIADEVNNNPFAFGILQSMAFRYLHLFHIKARDRQRLCSILKIEFSASQKINFKTKDVKLLAK